MKTITLSLNRYGDGYESADIRVLGGKHIGGTHLGFNPDNMAKHGFPAMQGKLDQWVLYAVQHCTVIDNHGGSGAQIWRMEQQLHLGEPFRIECEGEAVGGVWMLVQRDRRKLEGDGFKPVPYVDPVETDQSKYTAVDGTLRYVRDGSRVFPGPSGVRTVETVAEDWGALA